MRNPKELFATLNVAIELFRLGFRERCCAYYLHSILITEQPWIDHTNPKTPHILNAPLWQQVFEWLKEKYNVTIEPITTIVKDEKYDGTTETKFRVLMISKPPEWAAKKGAGFAQRDFTIDNEEWAVLKAIGFINEPNKKV
jgi:hypothetical protein